MSWPRRNKGKANVRRGQKTGGDKGLFFCKDLRKNDFDIGNQRVTRIKTERQADGGVTSVTVLQLQLGLCDKNGAERKKKRRYELYIIYPLAELKAYNFYEEKVAHIIGI